MSLPSSLSSFLWSGPPSTLAGISLGAPISSLSLPSWWSDQHSDGKVRDGAWDLDEGGVSQVCASLELVHERVASIDLTVELNDADAERAAYDALIAALTTRLGKPTSKHKRDVHWRDVDGTEFKADVHVRLAGFSGDVGEAFRVEIRCSLAHGEEIKADARRLFVDVDAVAAIYASAAFPVDVCRAAFAAWFAHEYPGQASPDERKTIHAIQDAALAARPQLKQAMIERLLALVDVSDLNSTHSARTAFLLDGVVSYVRQSAAPRTWVDVDLGDVWPFLRELDVPAAERAAVVRDVVIALAFDDAAARAAVAARLKDKPPTRPWLPFRSAPDVVARAYALLSAYLADDEARLLWPKDGGYETAPAVVAFFAHAHGKSVTAQSFDGYAYYASNWGDWLLLVKTHFPHRLDDAVAIFVARQSFDQRGWRAVLDAVADEGAPGPTSTWRIGSHHFQHSGKPNAGRWKVTREAPGDSAPKKKAASKKAASTKAASTKAASTTSAVATKAATTTTATKKTATKAATKKTATKKVAATTKTTPASPRRK